MYTLLDNLSEAVISILKIEKNKMLNDPIRCKDTNSIELQSMSCPVGRNFRGSYKKIFTCAVCNKQSVKEENFTDISLTLHNTETNR